MPRAHALAAALLLAGCAQAQAERDACQDEIDPAVARALMAPLLTDPELVSPDSAPLDGSLPPDDFAPSTVTGAREEGRRLSAGAKLASLGSGGACPGCDALFLDERARLLGAACRLAPALEWSLRLPADLPIYPKSHLREGAGSDDPACRARAASFTAPVPADEVLAFYRALAAKAGYRLSPAGPQAFVGRRGAQRMAVVVRSGEGGFAQFDLMTEG